MGEVFNEWKKDKQAKKRSNERSSTNMLLDMGIEFESKNSGNHLVVGCGDTKIDFWPSTGRFISRDGKHDARGINNLLKVLSSYGVWVS